MFPTPTVGVSFIINVTRIAVVLLRRTLVIKCLHKVTWKHLLPHLCLPGTPSNKICSIVSQVYSLLLQRTNPLISVDARIIRYVKYTCRQWTILWRKYREEKIGADINDVSGVFFFQKRNNKYRNKGRQENCSSTFSVNVYLS